MTGRPSDPGPQPFFGILTPTLVDALIGACVGWQRQRRADGLHADPEVSDFVTTLAGARRGLAGTTLAPGSTSGDHESMTRLLAYPEAAARLAVSERHLKRLVAAGDLPRVRIGAASRIHTDDLERFLTTLRRKAS